MGQVPPTPGSAHAALSFKESARTGSNLRDTLKYNLPLLIVGSGRLAKHLSFYFQSEGLGYKQWNRSDLSANFNLAEDSNLQPGHQEESHLSRPHRILLAVADSAIGELADLPWPKGSILVHFSGALSFPHVLGQHPLMTFTESLYDPALYRSIPFVGESPQPPFTELFPELPNPFFTITKDKKPLYHALCALSGNMTVRLWQRVTDEFGDQLGLPANILDGYRTQIFVNIQRDLQNALTGPLARGDSKTVESHLKALQKSSLGKIYNSFVEDFRENPPRAQNQTEPRVGGTILKEDKNDNSPKFNSEKSRPTKNINVDLL